VFFQAENIPKSFLGDSAETLQRSTGPYYSAGKRNTFVFFAPSFGVGGPRVPKRAKTALEMSIRDWPQKG